MNFSIISVSAPYLDTMKEEFAKAELKFNIFKVPSKIEGRANMSVCLVDIDSVDDKEFIEALLDNEKIVSIYLTSSNPQEAALDYPKAQVISSNIDALSLLKMSVRHIDKYMWMQSEKKRIKEERRKQFLDTNPTPEEAIPIKMPIVVEEPAEEDDLEPAPKKAKPKTPIVIEDAFSAYEDLSFVPKGSGGTPAEPPKPIAEPKAEDTAQGTDFSRRLDRLKKKYYDKNTREDRDSTEEDVIERLEIKKELMCPKINGVPLEYIDCSPRVIVDRELTAYRIIKLKKRGMKDSEILDQINQLNEQASIMRSQQLNEREARRKALVEKMNKEKREKKEAEIEKPAPAEKPSGIRRHKSSEFMDLVEKNKQANTTKQADQEVEKEKLMDPSKLESIIKSSSVGNNSGFIDIMAQTSEKVETAFVSELPSAPPSNEPTTETESLLAKIRRERSAAQNVDEGKSSISDMSLKLPQTKLIDSNPVAKKRAIERMAIDGVRASEIDIRPPSNLLETDEDDGKKKKKGFGFFGKKKK